MAAGEGGGGGCMLADFPLEFYGEYKVRAKNNEYPTDKIYLNASEYNKINNVSREIW